MILFSEFPGRRERHLLRKGNNPLFGDAGGAPTEGAVQEAQRLDHEELVAFIGHFRQLVLRASRLRPNEGSEVILALKEELDKAYEQAAGLADDQRETQGAIERLVEVIMQSVRRGAGDDPVARREIADEEQARAAHYELLRYPLVADLLCPDSPIAEGELAATLLSTDDQELAAVLELFDAAQLALLCAQGRELLTAASAAGAARRLGMLEQRLAALRELAAGSPTLGLDV
jgi:hypothetical protein